MKKVNKIFMTTVAILLCLVLISTSTLSGIFAKFVIKRDSEVSVSIKQFGLVLAVNKGADAGSNVTMNSTTQNGDTVSVSLSGVSISPNFDSYPKDVINFTISGTPNVDKVKLRLSLEITGVESFAIAKNEILGIPAGNHIPMGFMTTILPDSARLSTSDVDYWNVPKNNDDLEKKIIAGIVADVKADSDGKLGGAYKPDDSGVSKYAIEAVNDNTLEMEIWNTGIDGNKRQVNGIKFGFRPYRYSYAGGTTTVVTDLTRLEASILQNHIAEKNPQPSLTLTYTVTLEQVID